MKLDPTEWNLTACPSNQQEACCLYEYGRSSPAIRQAVKELTPREEKFLLMVPSFLEAVFCNEFPMIPWLQIAEKRRIELISKVGKERRANQNRLVVSLPDRMTIGGFPIRRPITRGNTTYVPIRLAWEWHSDTEFVEQFRDVLKRYRPPQYEMKRSGRHSPNDCLRALGARRLIEHYSAGSTLANPKTREIAGAKQAVTVISQHYAEASGNDHKPELQKRKQKLGMDVFTSWKILRDAAHKSQIYLAKFFRFPTDESFRAGGQLAFGYFEDPEYFYPSAEEN